MVKDSINQTIDVKMPSVNIMSQSTTTSMAT